MTPNSHSNFEKEEQSRRDHNTWHQTILQGQGIKTVWYWHKNRHIDQWNRIESPEINPSLYGQLTFDKGGRSIKWNKNSLFNKWWWENWTATCKKMKFDHQLTPYTKINVRWIKDLNISCDTIKSPREEHRQENLDIPRRSIFIAISPRTRDIKERVNKWDFIKIKASAWLKKTSAKWKGNQPYGKMYLQMLPWTWVWSLKYLKNKHDSTPGRLTVQLKNGKGPEQTLLMRTHRGPRDIWKDAQHH